MTYSEYYESSSNEEDHVVGDERYRGKWIGSKFYAVRHWTPFRPSKELSKPTVVDRKGLKLQTGRKLPKK